MAHELESINGKASFVSAREHAWHGLGTILDSTFTAETALREANLSGWNVRKAPLTALTENGIIEVPNRFATIRNNPGNPEQIDYLGVVGDKYTPIQNEEHCELLNTLVDESGAHFETAGSLRDGKEVFVTMKLPNHINIGGVDPIETYIAALNSHDGSGSFKLLVTPVRIVCANTQAAAIRGAKHSFSVRHTLNAAQAMATARQALDITFQYIDGFQQEADRMIQTELNNKAFFDIVKDVTGDADKAKDKASRNRLSLMQDDLVNLFESSPTATTIRGTAWAGYQAFTEYADFFSPVRTKGDQQRARALRALAENGLGVKAGTGEGFKAKAFRLLAAV